MAQVLWIMFLSIFGLTALLTLASLPDWITIPEWYRKKLFVALLLQVVGAVIILFKNTTSTLQLETTTRTDTVFINQAYRSDKQLQAFRNTLVSNAWNIQNESTQLGFVTLDVEQTQLIADSLRTQYKVNKKYQVGDFPLFFKIDSISPYLLGKLYTYYIRFGEQNASDSIHWEKELHEFYKTPNGELNLNNGLLWLRDGRWQNVYYISLGVGQPSDNFVNFLNLLALKITLD
jgi:hypothetical protein